MPEGAPRLVDVQGAIVATQGDPAATLRDLVDSTDTVNGNVQVSIEELVRIRDATEGLLTIPEIDIPAEGQLTWPARLAYLLEQSLARETATSNILAAVLLRLNGPDQTQQGTPTGIVSITERLDQLVAGSSSGLAQEQLDAMVFVGTRLTDLINAQAAQHAQLLTVLGGLQATLAIVADCVCPDVPLPDPEPPLCLPSAPARVVSWAASEITAIGSVGYQLFAPFFGDPPAGGGIQSDGRGNTGGRHYYRNAESGPQSITVGYNQPDLPTGSKLLVRNVTLTANDEAPEENPFVTSQYITTDIVGPGCVAFNTNGVDDFGLFAGDVVIEVMLAIPAASVGGTYTGRGFWLAPGGIGS